MKKEYDFSHGVRGKYAKKFASGHNLVKISPDLQKYFPTTESVNFALKSIIQAMTHGKAQKA